MDTHRRRDLRAADPEVAFSGILIQGNLNLPIGGGTPIPLGFTNSQTEDFVQNTGNFGGNEVVVPVAGFWYIGWAAAIQRGTLVNSDRGAGSASIRRNGVVIPGTDVYTYSHNGGAPRCATGSGTCEIELAAGDEVQLYGSTQTPSAGVRLAGAIPRAWMMTLRLMNRY